jgi:O-6-methylguanine DNA methyltransferase
MNTVETNGASTRNTVRTETLWYSRMGSPVGALAVVVSEQGLCAVEFGGENFPGALKGPAYQGRRIILVEDCEVTRPFVRELQAYFDGALREFSVPLDLRGTDFQKQCWRALLRIPYGATQTYADVAKHVGRPTAFRAVGMANHSNPVPIVVPCHRVLASSGSLCGYGGGLHIKEHLLRFEGAIF